MITQEEIDFVLAFPNNDTRTRRKVRREINHAVYDVVTEVVSGYLDELHDEIIIGDSIVTGQMVEGIIGINVTSPYHYRRRIGALFPPTLRMVSSGTQQRLPPIKPTNTTVGPYGLQDWVEMKGLVSERYKTSHSLAWAIAKSIEANGVTPAHYREQAAGGDDVFEALQEKIHRGLENKLGSDYVFLIQNFMTYRTNPFEIGVDF